MPGCISSGCFMSLKKQSNSEIHVHAVLLHAALDYFGPSLHATLSVYFLSWQQALSLAIHKTLFISVFSYIFLQSCRKSQRTQEIELTAFSRKVYTQWNSGKKRRFAGQLLKRHQNHKKDSTDRLYQEPSPIWKMFSSRFKKRVHFDGFCLFFS